VVFQWHFDGISMAIATAIVMICIYHDSLNHKAKFSAFSALQCIMTVDQFF
jgi:hypothetical protein